MVMIEVIEHVANQGHLLGELRRVLKADGVIIMTTPNMHCIEARGKLFFKDVLRQFDVQGDPTHVAPLFIYPFSTLLRWYRLGIVFKVGVCQGMTTEPLLRIAASIVRAFRIVPEIKGDILLLIIEAVNHEGLAENPIEVLTSHYSA